MQWLKVWALKSDRPRLESWFLVYLLTSHVTSDNCSEPQPLSSKKMEGVRPPPFRIVREIK